MIRPGFREWGVPAKKRRWVKRAALAPTSSLFAPGALQLADMVDSCSWWISGEILWRHLLIPLCQSCLGSWSAGGHGQCHSHSGGGVWLRGVAEQSLVQCIAAGHGAGAAPIK